MSDEGESSASGIVLYNKGDGNDDEEVWDDSALIEAYDKAVNRAFDDSNSYPLTKKKHKRTAKKKSVKQWKVSDKCQAQFSEDELWYPATIISIDTKSKSCIVRYDEYENEEEQLLDDIVELPSENASTSAAVESDELASKLAPLVAERMDQDQSFASAASAPAPFLAPPRDMDEAMGSMLLSWYMSGYHTGYYQAMKDMQSQQQ